MTSNEAGQYTAPGLRIGRYTLKAELKGFKSVEQKGIVLNVGDRLPVDFKLEVGATQESVTVEANAVQVQSESSEVSSVITDQQVSQLATNGRSLYNFVNLTTGASNLQGDFQTPT
jgi:predicted acetyltransferase